MGHIFWVNKKYTMEDLIKWLFILIDAERFYPCAETTNLRKALETLITAIRKEGADKEERGFALKEVEMDEGIPQIIPLKILKFNATITGLRGTLEREFEVDIDFEEGKCPGGLNALEAHIPAQEYTRAEFIKAVKKRAEEALTTLLRLLEEEEKNAPKREELMKEVNQLVEKVKEAVGLVG